MLGRTGVEAWGEVWDVIGPMFERVMTHGEATWSDDQLLELQRRGFREETYFTWSYSPMRDETGSVGGTFTAVMETTDRVLSARRLLTLRELSEQAFQAMTVEAACRVAMATPCSDARDAPRGNNRAAARTKRHAGPLQSRRLHPHGHWSLRHEREPVRDEVLQDRLQTSWGGTSGADDIIVSA